jgi:3-hydroxybutyrate dehydrogenase
MTSRSGPPAPFSLAGRRAIVTGGGTGIGRGIALALAGAGADVAICGRRPEPLAATAREIRAAGRRAPTRAFDVTDAAAVAGALPALARELGGLEILVNNAGVGGPNGCAVDGPDRWDVVLRTNLDGLFFCTRAAAPLLADGTGRVVNVSSVLGRFGVPGYTAYCASKHGVIGFTKALALELAPRRITANSICPGWVETEMAQAGLALIARQTGSDYETARAGALGQVPLQRILQPDEIGALVVYLCSDAASGMTGQAIALDGGATSV